MLWKHLQPGSSHVSTFRLTSLFIFFFFFFTLFWLHLRRAAHSLAERGAGCHLLGEDERDLAPPARFLAAGGNCDVSLTAAARAMTPRVYFSVGRQKPSVISQQASQSSVNSKLWLLEADAVGHLVHVVLSIMVIKAMQHSHKTLFSLFCELMSRLCQTEARDALFQRPPQICLVLK